MPDAIQRLLASLLELHAFDQAAGAPDRRCGSSRSWNDTLMAHAESQLGRQISGVAASKHFNCRMYR